EARDKLYELGLWTDAVEDIISTLISENYINEERFAKAYAGGKFRIKKWGRLKIKMGLKQKRISDYSIKMGMKEIKEELYLENLTKILESKNKTLRSEKNAIAKKYKLVKFAQSKGYETDLVLEVLKSLE
ncbi:MAG: RecX family transcriptional regulator, partial [Bacteroidia bacterium]|nr:RecX family transcriptional regulator [Bacteroidia bacterium]